LEVSTALKDLVIQSGTIIRDLEYVVSLAMKLEGIVSNIMEKLNIEKYDHGKFSFRQHYKMKYDGNSMPESVRDSMEGKGIPLEQIINFINIAPSVIDNIVKLGLNKTNFNALKEKYATDIAESLLK
jgi:hypothetical protein